VSNPTEVSAEITRKSASNLALAFILLPPEKRAAMSALYAFCRQVDDVADEESVPAARRREELAAWRDDVRIACSGGAPHFPVNRELQPCIARYRLPFDLFDELIQGVEMDLELDRYPDYPTLERYCYRVASVVGLLSIEIFGYSNPACRQYADALGKALQLTNILRDVGNDATRGRIYIPATELNRFRVPADDLLQRRWSERFHELARTVGAQARAHYARARAALPPEDARHMVSAELMGTVYWQLLRKLERSRFQVLADRPLKLSKAHKLWLVFGALIRARLGIRFANYGV
jgi:15-cis-phytoene synthase